MYNCLHCNSTVKERSHDLAEEVSKVTLSIKTYDTVTLGPVSPVGKEYETLSQAREFSPRCMSV